MGWFGGVEVVEVKTGVDDQEELGEHASLRNWNVLLLVHCRGK